MSPLEQRYPNRCFDCLTIIGNIDELLCPKCKRLYRDLKKR